MTPTTFSRRLFTIAGIYGLLVLLPYYFLEQRIGLDFPPPITHPEFFYGFVGVALAWQVAFLLIAQDPVRYRLIIIPGILEKLGFGIAVLVLLAQGRVPMLLSLAAAIDLTFATLFAWAFVRLRV